MCVKKINSQSYKRNTVDEVVSATCYLVAQVTRYRKIEAIKYCRLYQS